MIYIIGVMIEQGYGKTRKNILICILVGDIIKTLAAVILFPYLWKGAEKIKV